MKTEDLLSEVWKMGMDADTSGKPSFDQAKQSGRLKEIIDTLSKMKNSNILFKIPAKLVKDKNGTWTIYNKKYNISGYGKTIKEATEMFNFCVDDILKFKR